MAKDIRVPLTEAQKAKIKGTAGGAASEKGREVGSSPEQKTTIAQGDLRAQDMSADISAEDLVAEDMSADISAEDLVAEDMSADISAEDLVAEDTSAAGDPEAQ